MTQELCPWLGTAQDREIRLLEPSDYHVCYAQSGSDGSHGHAPHRLDSDYQVEFCLQTGHRACPLYREPPTPVAHAPRGDVLFPATPASVTELRRQVQGEEDDLAAGPEEHATPTRRFPRPGFLLWAVPVLALAVVVYLYLSALLAPVAGGEQAGAVVSPTPSAGFTLSPALPGRSPTGVATEPPPSETGIPAPALGRVEPAATPTPYPGGTIYSLEPDMNAAGWVASNEANGNHLGDSYLYSGVFDGEIYHGVFRIDLSVVPRGATIHSAALELTGLDGRRLGSSGAWEVRLLRADSGEEWARRNYQDLHNAPVEWTLVPALGVADLVANGATAFNLPQELLRTLEQRLIDEQYTLSFRIDGPLTGENSVFAWDSGYGPASQGRHPRLLLNVGPPPATPLPTGAPPVIVVTSMPTPADVMTAAARVQTATSVALTTGQPTPTSIYEWTATPTHAVAVVTSTPTPANRATAAYWRAVATAVALTTGTFTPTPVTQWTATPTPALVPEALLTRTPTPTPLPARPSDLVGMILFRSNRAGTAGPWAMDPDGGSLSLLTSPWPYDVAANLEAVSPDGTRVVYTGKVDGRSAVLIGPALEPGQPPNLSAGKPVIAFDSGTVSSPVWSPTGSLLAFVHSVGGTAQIWVVNPNGSGALQLTNSSWGSASHPTFSPDGARLAFAVADEWGNRQIWTISVTGGDRLNVSNNLHDEHAPVWVK